MVKPFSVRELMLRLKAILRRAQAGPEANASLVKAMGGRVSVQSGLGAGATFIVEVQRSGA